MVLLTKQSGGGGNKYDKGWFATEASLLVSYPNGITDPNTRQGRYVRIEDTDTIRLRDVDTNMWIDTGANSYLETVTTDETLTGDGTVLLPLGVVHFIEKTYAELLALSLAQLLKPGQRYKMTDYKTVYYIINSNPKEADESLVQPLFLRALTNATFQAECYSENYPQDIIYYSFLGNSDDDAFFYTNKGSRKAITGFTGMITYRLDTIKNVSAFYDWRNIKIRRYHAVPAYHDDGTTYAKFDVSRT